MLHRRIRGRFKILQDFFFQFCDKFLQQLLRSENPLFNASRMALSAVAFQSSNLGGGPEKIVAGSGRALGCLRILTGRSARSI